MEVHNGLQHMFALHKRDLDYFGIFKIHEVRIDLKKDWQTDPKVKVSIRGEKTYWMSSDEFIVSHSVEELEMWRDKLMLDKLTNRLTFQVNV
jgi:hypothetical protein